MSEKVPEPIQGRQNSIQFFAEADPRLAGPRLSYRGPPPPPPDDEIRLEDVWRVLRRQWWVILLSFVVVVSATYIYTAGQIPVWQASADIRVEAEGASPTDAMFGNFGGGEYLETEMLVAGTRPVLERVVEQLSLQFQMTEPAGVPRHFLFSYQEFGRDAPGASYEIRATGSGRYQLSTLAPATLNHEVDFAAGDTVHLPGGSFVLQPDAELLTAGGLVAPDRIQVSTVPFNAAVGGLKGALEVSRPDDWASIFRLTYRSTDRWLVRNVVNGSARAFIAKRREDQKAEASSAVDFLETQTAEVLAELEVAEGQLQAFREGQGAVDLASEANLQVQQLAGWEAERLELEGQRDDLQRLLRQIQTSGGPAPDYTRLAAHPVFLENGIFQNYLQQLTEAERTRAELRGRWTENHPQVLSLNDQISLLKDRLRDLGENVLQTLNSRIGTLNVTLDRFGSDLAEIPARELQFARLERKAGGLVRLHETLLARLKEWEVQEAVDDSRIHVVEEAVLPTFPVSPNPRRNLTLGAMVGLFLGLGLAFLRQMLDKTLRPDDDVGQMLGVSVLSRVPRLPEMTAKTPRSKALVTLHNGRSLPAEAYRNLRSSIFFSDVGGNGKRELVVTSPGARDGKSVTSCNLAITFAQQGHKTLLIDGDLRRSTLHLTFEISDGTGLTEFLGGDAPMEGLIRSTKVPNLFVIPSGKTPGNPSELLGGARFDELLERARDHFDAIVVDSPPVLAVTDATVLANKVEGVVLVVRSDQTHKQAAEDALEQLYLVGAKVLGVVVNDTDGGGRYGYRYSYYYKYYGHDEKKRRKARR